MTHASNKNIPYLDGWRGVAIALVLICHFGDPSREWIGELGVLIFFVLSGFLMSRLLFVTQVQLKEFFKRRFNRIVPTFWLFTLTVVIYSRWIQTIPTSTHPDTQAQLLGLKVPNWEDMKAYVENAAKAFPGLRFQAWDIAATSDGVCAIELNLATLHTVYATQLVSHQGFLDETLARELAPYI